MIKDKQLTFVWIFIIGMIGFIGVFAAYRYGLPSKLLVLSNKNTDSTVNNQYPENIKISSNAFSYGDSIPEKYTCKGLDINPPLTISGNSVKIKSYVIILDDPDALYKVWTHWIVYNIDPLTTQLFENFVPKTAVLGQNDFGTDKYRGPCPPIGKHTYRFRLYALDTKLTLKTGATREEIENAMDNHILDRAELQGTFGK